jgi:hypothetical protein
MRARSLAQLVKALGFGMTPSSKVSLSASRLRHYGNFPLLDATVRLKP